MKQTILSILMISLTTFSARAGVQKSTFECRSQTQLKNVAILAFTKAGVTWNEQWHSASSIAEPNSSEEVGDIYELSDFFSDEDGGFQLVISHELANGKVKGIVEVLFKGKSEGVYFCK